MTKAPDLQRSSTPVEEVLARELAAEQRHVDRVYSELDKASARARSVAAEGMARGRTERTGEARDEEMTGLFERDALVFHAARRQHALDTQHEGLVFGRLDLDNPVADDGEEFSFLCDPGLVCVDGMCQPMDPVLPPDDESDPAFDDDGAPAGCGCRTHGDGAGAVVMLGLGAMLFGLRRRRR